MSIVETYKSEFRILGFDEDIPRGEKIGAAMKKRGFQYEAFSSRGLLMESLKGELPHVFLLHYQPLNMKFRQTLSAIREASDEVKIVLFGTKQFWPGIQNLIRMNLADDFWSWPMAEEGELELRLNQLIEKDIYRFLAEQKSQETQVIVDRLQQMEEREASLGREDENNKRDESVSFLDLDIKTESQILDAFIQNLKSHFPTAEFIYFKNYQAKNQLLATMTSFSSDNYFRGQAVNFLDEDYKKNPAVEIENLRNQISEQFSVSDFSMERVEFSDDFFGVVVAVHFQEPTFLKKSCRYLSLALRNYVLESQKRQVVVDPYLDLEVPGAQFPLHLSKEVSRARRLKSPVSLIIGQIEYIHRSDEELKKALSVIKQSLRSYDFVSLLPNNQFAIVLPHCGFEDGAIKAETLRRQLVAQGLKIQNAPLRLCFGVSEFPTLSKDSDTLYGDTEKACQQVMVSGKNKVCLYTAEPDHEPEFGSL